MTTPQEKAKRTRERKKLEEEQRLRNEEMEQERELLEGRAMKEAYYLLESELAGLYDEIDKLAKKAPNEPVTSLQMKIVNSFVKKSKHLLSGDTFIDEIEIFVSAGDNPEYRDFITVLRQIRQGLERFKARSFIFTKGFAEELSQWDFEEEPGDFFESMRSQDGPAE